jgi:hypothetical protein
MDTCFDWRDNLGFFVAIGSAGRDRNNNFDKQIKLCTVKTIACIFEK